MNDETARGVHWSFWVIGAVALIWNVMGAMNYVMQMNADMLAAMPDNHRAIAESRPIWATAGFAVAVFGGALGSVLLLLRSSAAFYVFIASALGVAVTMIHALVLSGAASTFSPFQIFLAVLMPIVAALFLIWYSKQAESKGWISQEALKHG